jgi:hypothetical protein
MCYQWESKQTLDFVLAHPHLFFFAESTPTLVKCLPSRSMGFVAKFSLCFQLGSLLLENKCYLNVADCCLGTHAKPIASLLKWHSRILLWKSHIHCSKISEVKRVNFSMIHNWEGTYWMHTFLLEFWSCRHHHINVSFSPEGRNSITMIKLVPNAIDIVTA